MWLYPCIIMHIISIYTLTVFSDSLCFTIVLLITCVILPDLAIAINVYSYIRIEVTKCMARQAIKTFSMHLGN